MTAEICERFTQARRLAWLDQVASDRKNVSPAVFRLSYIISGIVADNGTDECSVSITELGLRLGISREGAKHLVDKLRRSGHVEIFQRMGRGNANTYRPILRARPTISRRERYRTLKIQAAAYRAILKEAGVDL